MSIARHRASDDDDDAEDARATREDAAADDDGRETATAIARRDDATTRWSAVTIACACAAIGTVLAVASATTGGVESVMREGYARARVANLASEAPRRYGRVDGALERESGAMGARAMDVKSAMKSVSASPPTWSPPPPKPPPKPKPKPKPPSPSPPSPSPPPPPKPTTAIEPIIDPKCDEWTAKLAAAASAPEFEYDFPAYTCSNEHEAPCIQDFQFMKLQPDACDVLKRDEDWPGRFMQRAPGVKNGGDLVRALGADNTIVVIGASMTKQIEIAMDCSIRRAGVDKSQSAKIMKRWGWARWSFDSQTCELDHMVAARTGGDINYWFSAKEYVDGCWKDTKAFDINVLGCEGAIDDCDASSRVVVLMYNIEHYGGLGNVEFFEKETEFLVKRAVSLGAKVVLATSPPKHFSADGAYSKEAYITKIKSETVCTCTPTVESIDKNPAWRGYFEAIERLSRIPGVLGVIDILRSSMKEFYRSHKGGHCGYYVDEVPGENSQKPKREVKYKACCDCTHYCFDPALWDQYFLDPLVDILDRGTSPAS